MNTEHIISLARKAGWGFSNSRDSDFVKAQLCFAELVAAEERERLAKVFDELDKGIGFYDPHEPAEIIRGQK